MGNGKKKRSKKDKASGDILDLAHASVKKFRKVTKEISKLSTGQKLVGGLALAAAGLVYLASQEDSHAAPGAAAQPAPPDEEAPAVEASPAHTHAHKSRKRPKIS